MPVTIEEIKKARADLKNTKDEKTKEIQKDLRLKELESNLLQKASYLERREREINQQQLALDIAKQYDEQYDDVSTGIEMQKAFERTWTTSSKIINDIENGQGIGAKLIKNQGGSSEIITGSSYMTFYGGNGVYIDQSRGNHVSMIQGNKWYYKQGGSGSDQEVSKPENEVATIGDISVVMEVTFDDGSTGTYKVGK